MSEKITKLVKELQEKNEELQTEISSLSKTNLTLLDDLKKKFEWDKDLLKEWYEFKGRLQEYEELLRHLDELKFIIADIECAEKYLSKEEKEKFQRLKRHGR